MKQHEITKDPEVKIRYSGNQLKMPMFVSKISAVLSRMTLWFNLIFVLISLNFSKFDGKLDYFLIFRGITLGIFLLVLGAMIINFVREQKSPPKLYKILDSMIIFCLGLCFVMSVDSSSLKMPFIIVVSGGFMIIKYVI